MIRLRAIIALGLIFFWTGQSLATVHSLVFARTDSLDQNQLHQWSGTAVADFLLSSREDLRSDSDPSVRSDSHIFSRVAESIRRTSYAPPTIDPKLDFFAALFIRAP